MAISRYNGKTNSMVFCPLSFSCCAIALVLQIFEIKHRVQIEDWAAIMDTIGPLSWVSVILVVITIFLNVIAINIRKTNN
ncbi:hypothetical protein [Desulfofalx alkaliphila]|uniref:hypothetical protein n=1 Tax=Desulfofalx alkaliphila TaxID=105483 RepID=UPI000A04B9B0|nr:hypothetical protein [Desulfofalx alkaliphila]